LTVADRATSWPLEEIARKDWSFDRAESQAIFNDKAADPWPAPQPPKRST
jgi:hypothetical protein